MSDKILYEVVKVHKLLTIRYMTSFATQSIDHTIDENTMKLNTLSESINY